MIMKKVISIELVTTIAEHTKKSKRHDYARGGYLQEDVIVRTTYATPTAVLECGHTRTEGTSGTVVSKAKKLMCYKCERGK